MSVNDKSVSVRRLNYIGSKWQLLEWIDTTINKFTEGTKNNKNTLKVADLFAGTGIVSWWFRSKNYTVYSNDSELYSFVITSALNRSIYTDVCKKIITMLNKELEGSLYTNYEGYITKVYSPHLECERKFFTVDNARRIDWIRNRLAEIKLTISQDEYHFLLASLIISADSVSNVPAVYGCYLKNFKAKALKSLVLKPIHELEEPCQTGSKVWNSDILDLDLHLKPVDVVYLDPPYNGRQYSKNYFCLNVIAMESEQQEQLVLKGKTGIPDNSFISSFCKKTSIVSSFEKMIESLALKCKLLVMSYNNEGLLSKETITKTLEKYGTVKIEQKEYKKFKSFEYNENAKVIEYLFCLTTK